MKSVQTSRALGSRPWTGILLPGAFLAAATAAAQPDTPAPSDAPPIDISAHETSREDPRGALGQLASDAKFFRLSNGIRVILYRRGVAPVFAGVVAVRVGGTDEQVGNTGISHMFEHMAFKGTPTVGSKNYAREAKLLAQIEEIMQRSGGGGKLSPDEQQRLEKINEELKSLWVLNEFSREYEKRGASEMNATTDKELTKYFVNLPRASFDFWCRMESDRLLYPVMRQFYQERDVVREERRMRFEDDPQGKLYESLLATAYQRHPYRNPIIGYDFDIERLTASQTDAFRRKYYVPSNIAISVVGDVDPVRDIVALERCFGRIPAAQETITRPEIREAPQEGERRVTLKASASPQFFVAYHKPNYPHPDDPAISVLGEILVGGRTSPVYTELVKRRRLASDVGHEEAPGLAYPNLMLFYATVKSPHTNDEVLKAFDEVIEDFSDGPVSEEKLEIAKRAVAMGYLTHMKSSLSLAQDFASSELLFDNWKASLTWYDEVVAVTAADVQRIAKTYLREETRTIGLLETIGGGESAKGKGS